MLFLMNQRKRKYKHCRHEADWLLKNEGSENTVDLAEADLQQAQAYFV